MDLRLPLELQQRLNANFPDEIAYLVPLSELSYWKIGGLAQCVIKPKSIQSLQSAFSYN